MSNAHPSPALSDARSAPVARAEAQETQGVYRNDIEGLRAIAVLLVLLYHLDLRWLSGGFVGVDVFYVISGYLITRNIIRDGDAFQLGRFWLRRVRRLMPAIMVVSALTVIAAILVMTPEDAHGVIVSAVAASVSVSNFLFWLQSGYWDTSSAFKPLLHTWSLGVEEQFYLVWPILLIAVRPFFGRRAMTVGFAILLAAGAILSQWMLKLDPRAAFYLMPFRIMEFASGALVTTIETDLSRLFAWTRIGICLAGITAVLWSAFHYNAAIPFPGFAALVPALGASLMIASGAQSLSKLILENVVTRYLGRISYSIYLTHWPLISFYKYATLNALDLRIQIILGVATLATGAMLYHAVEKPFRYGRKFPLAYATALGMCLAVGLPVALAVHSERAASEGVRPWREALNIADKTWQAEREQSRCEYDAPCAVAGVPGQLSIYVIGDSHGIDGFNIFKAAFPDAHIVLLSGAGCDPLIGVGSAVYQVTAEQHAACDQLIADLYGKDSKLSHADVIVFSSLIQSWFDTALDRSLAALAHFHKPIIVIGNSPVFTQPLRDIVRTRNLTPRDTVPLQFEDRWYDDDLERRLHAVANRRGAGYLSLRDWFCPGGRCMVFTPDGTRLVSYDRHHLSLAAAQAFGRARSDLIRAELRRRESF